MKTNIRDVQDNQAGIAIIGGGIMGLLSAYRLSQQGLQVTVIEAAKIGGSQAASSGITRSIRNDYSDPLMAKMANSAFIGWQDLEKEFNTQLIDECGCLNIYNSALTSLSREESYAAGAAKWLKRDGREFEECEDVSTVFPGLEAEYAVLDSQAGIAMPRKAITELISAFKITNNVTILENTKLLSVERDSTTNRLTLKTSQGSIQAAKVVVAAGLGTSYVSQQLLGPRAALPITPDRPFELKYFFTDDKQYSTTNMPVFAFLDIGIYGHPVVDGVTPGVKIGYYHPPGIETKPDDSISFIDKFVETCLPDLKRKARDELITEVDQCSYDMTPDNKFILGYLGDGQDIVVAAGFNGTGFKYAPVISKIVAQLATNQTTSYDISEYNPNRFL